MKLTSLKSGSSYDLPGGPLIEGTFLVFTGTVQDLKTRTVINFYTASGDVSIVSLFTTILKINQTITTSTKPLHYSTKITKTSAPQ